MERRCLLLLLAVLHSCCVGAWRPGPRPVELTDAGQWGQCGGSDHCPSDISCGDQPWHGVAACPTGFSCVRLDALYWQCQPGHPSTRSARSSDQGVNATAGVAGPYAQCGGTNGPCPTPPCKDMHWAKCPPFVSARVSTFGYASQALACTRRMRLKRPHNGKPSCICPS